MKKLFALIASLFSVIFHLSPVTAQPTDNSLLWRISGKGLSKPSYLFGTMHLICKQDYVWTKNMENSLGKSEKICFEMDMDDPAVLLQVAAGLIDNSGKKLKDYFTPEQYQAVKHYLKDSMNMDITLFEQMKPVALQTIMSTSNSGCTDQVSYEDSIMKTAQKEKKEILGLESPQEQLTVLESIPTDTVIAQLLDFIHQNNKDDSEYSQLISAYKQQDIKTLYTLILQSKELGDGMGVFLDDRNKKWIARMSGMMKHSSVFFAVGAGHLAGPNGVINLLAKDGYTVEAVK